MRCKHGDLAIIVQDFDGCERNIGVIVKVIGPAINHPETTMPCWQIKPMKRRKLWLVEGGFASQEFLSKDNPAYHPDPWLLPIKGKSNCRFHGGKSTGPKTPEGRHRCA